MTTTTSDLVASAYRRRTCSIRPSISPILTQAFTWMRANEPVYRDQTNDLWAVTRHADIRDVEGRPAEFLSGGGYRSFHSPGETNMIAQDDPRHIEQRKLVSRRFTPKAVRAHEPWLRSTIGSLVDQMLAKVRDGADGVEVVDAVAAQLPCRLTAAPARLGRRPVARPQVAGPSG